MHPRCATKVHYVIAKLSEKLQLQKLFLKKTEIRDPYIATTLIYVPIAIKMWSFGLGLILK